MAYQGNVAQWNEDMDAFGLSGQQRVAYLWRMYRHHKRIEALYWKRYERTKRAESWFAALFVVSVIATGCLLAVS